MSGVQTPRAGRRAEHGPEAGQATPSVVAVVSVVAIVVAMVAFFASGDDSTTTQAEDASSTQGITPSVPAQGPPTAARTPKAEKPDIAARVQPVKHKDGQHAQDKAAHKPRKQKRAQPTAGVPQVYVEVYNNTSISGLAASTGAELQDAGWQVVGVDNWYGDIPASTVYYPDGLAAEAHQLAEELGVERVRGAVPPMRFDRLTVILTEDAY
jgi:hypothetical protein